MQLDEFIYNLALGLPGLLLGVIVHEYAHGFVALKFGDRTAKLSGRLTFNPLPHLDVFGSVIVPLIGAYLGGVMFGWAKPVPVDTRNFKNYRKGLFWVSFAGPLSNFILVFLSAFFCALIMNKVSPSFSLKDPFVKMLAQSVYINTVIGIFNLIPFPPLDGSKMLSSVLSYNAQRKYEEIGRFGIIFFLLLMFTGISKYIFTPPLIVAQGVLNFFLYTL